jgi:hypothetical protein
MHPQMHLPGHGGVITPRAPLTLGVGAEPVKQRNVSGAPKAAMNGARWSSIPSTEGVCSASDGHGMTLQRM